MESSNHQRSYNYIYSKLVSDETDIFGHIAYALYKADKVEFIEKLKNEGKEVTEEDLQPFHQISCLETTLERYKVQAAVILDAFLNEDLKEHKTDIEKKYIENQQNHLSEIVTPLKQKFWNGVLQSFVGAIAFAIFLAAIAFVVTYSKDDSSVKAGIIAAKTMHMSNPAVKTDTIDSLQIIP